MDINIETLTRNLSEYSMEANNASIAISKGLQPVGIAILIIFFCVELLSWKNILNKNDKKLVVGLWGEFSLKYLIGFYFSDEFRGVVMNYFKTFIAYSLLGVVLLLITVIFGMVITQDFIKVATNNDSAWTGFLILIKEVVYILLIAGSVTKTKRLVGVQ